MDFKIQFIFFKNVENITEYLKKKYRNNHKALEKCVDDKISNTYFLTNNRKILNKYFYFKLKFHKVNTFFF